jgi:hypothetical protein
MAVVLAITLLGLLWIAGCGGFFFASNSTNGCLVVAFSVDPQHAAANHNALPPANTVRFSAFQTPPPDGCFVPTSTFVPLNSTQVTWKTSDASIATVSNAPDNTFGTVTCVAASASPVMVTASGKQANAPVTVASGTVTCQ